MKRSLGTVSERRRWRMQRGKRSGSNLTIGKWAVPTQTESWLQQEAHELRDEEDSSSQMQVQ